MTNNYVADPKLIEWMKDIRRTIHQYPELAFREFNTAAYLSRKLDELDIPHTKGIAGTGIRAVIGKKEQGMKSVALRADMDALPITEKTGLPFSSKNNGVMHACGHDGHMAMLLGAAAMLKKHTNLPGQVILLFQPAEEDDGGAEKMIAEGVLEGVDGIFGGHIERHFKVGEISVQPGLICAFTDEFRITICGPGGHAAKPHESPDCIVAASYLITCIQTLVSRETNPVYPAVVTIGKICGGSAANVIADRITLEGTIRSTHQEVREKIITSLKRMVKSIGELYVTETELIFTSAYPPVINNSLLAGIAQKAAVQTVGESGVTGQPYPSLGGEDFSFFLKHIPGCFVRFGGEREDLPHANAHSPIFDFDERVLPIGAEFFVRCAFLFLQQTDKT